jgi:acetamidase/formamidase
MLKPPLIFCLPATAQWGVYDSNQQPVLRIRPGDTVIIETMAASDNQIVPGTTIKQLIDIQNAVAGRGPHTVTGPIYVEGAEPGDILQIHFNKIVPRAYASNNTGPGKGLFPDVFSQPYIKYYYLDLKKMQMQFAPGIVVPLAPFPGIIAVARKEPGKYDTIPPGPFGGNMDLREMTAGTTLYLPVFMQGGLIWTGDSHAGQGNGEIDLTAIETAFSEFSITVNLIKNKPLTWPRVETKNAWISVGYDKDLNKALEILKGETIKLIMEERKLDKAEAEKFMLQTWNCPVAEVVNGIQGVYCMVPKTGEAKRPILPEVDNTKFFVTAGKDMDIEKAMKQASMAMINKIAQNKKMAPVDVYTLASFAMDCRIAPYQSGEKKIHCMMPKNLWVS